MQLAQLINPGQTALLSMEMQRGVVGDLSAIEPLVAAVKQGNVATNIGLLAETARSVGIPVVHCNAAFRVDRRGSTVNCPVLAQLSKNPQHMLTDTPATEVVPEIGVCPEDLACERLHGMSPFSGTGLNTLLRNMGVSTVIATGVSLNIGVIGLVIEAIGLGYNVVLARDCVAGFPQAYADDIIQHTLSLLAKVVSAGEITQCWAQTAPC